MVLMIFDTTGTAARLGESAAQASEWQTRLLYYQDALVMIRQGFFGYGTNGYHYAQSFYQTGSTYHVKFVHSNWLQSFLDMGIAGGLVMGAFFFYIGFIRRMPWERRMAIFLMVGHGLVDIDFQFSILWMLVLVLIWKNGYEGRFISVRSWHYGLGLMYALVLVYFLTAASLAAMERNEAALTVYPYYTEAYRQVMKSDDPVDEKKAALAQRVIELNPYVSEGYEVLRLWALEEDRIDDALMYSEQLIYYSPILIEHYEAYSHMLILSATYHHAYGNDGLAMERIGRIMTLPELLSSLANEKDTGYNVRHKPRLHTNGVMMKDYREAVDLLEVIEGNR